MYVWYISMIVYCTDQHMGYGRRLNDSINLSFSLVNVLLERLKFLAIKMLQFAMHNFLLLHYVLNWLNISAGDFLGPL